MGWAKAASFVFSPGEGDLDLGRHRQHFPATQLFGVLRGVKQQESVQTFVVLAETFPGATFPS